VKLKHFLFHIQPPHNVGQTYFILFEIHIVHEVHVEKIGEKF